MRRSRLEPAPAGVALSERAFQELVLDLALTTGWMAYHTWLSMHSERGFPDLVLVRPPSVLFVELKRERGKLSLAQRGWQLMLAACAGVEYHEWRPSDWPAIVARLGEGRVQAMI